VQEKVTLQLRPARPELDIKPVDRPVLVQRTATFLDTPARQQSSKEHDSPGAGAVHPPLPCTREVDCVCAYTADGFFMGALTEQAAAAIHDRRTVPADRFPGEALALLAEPAPRKHKAIPPETLATPLIRAAHAAFTSGGVTELWSSALTVHPLSAAYYSERGRDHEALGALGPTLSHQWRGVNAGSPPASDESQIQAVKHATYSAMQETEPVLTLLLMPGGNGHGFNT
jgi:hypothetical protein